MRISSRRWAPLLMATSRIVARTMPDQAFSRFGRSQVVDVETIHFQRDGLQVSGTLFLQGRPTRVPVWFWYRPVEQRKTARRVEGSRNISWVSTSLCSATTHHVPRAWPATVSLPARTRRSPPHWEQLRFSKLTNRSHPSASVSSGSTTPPGFYRMGRGTPHTRFCERSVTERPRHGVPHGVRHTF